MVEGEELNSLVKDKFEGLGGVEEKILGEIEKYMSKVIMQGNIQKIIQFGIKPISQKITKNLDRDLEQLQDRSLAHGELLYLRRSDDLERGFQYNDQVRYLEKALEDNHFASPVKKVDLAKDGDKDVSYMGETCKLRDIKDLVGDKGLKLVPGKNKDYLLRADYDDYIESISMGKKTNEQDLNIFAEHSGAQIELRDSNGKLIKIIGPAESQGPPIVMGFDKFGEGHYYPMQKNDQGVYIAIPNLVGNDMACAPRVMVYENAIKNGMSNKNA